MALVECAECKSEVSDKAAVCMRCGAPVAGHARPFKHAPSEKSPPRWPWIVGVAAVLFLGVGYIGSNSPEGQAKAKARDVIDLCRQDQSRASLDASTKQFVASTCERLESEFVQKFGSRP